MLHETEGGGFPGDTDVIERGFRRRHGSADRIDADFLLLLFRVQYEHTMLWSIMLLLGFSSMEMQMSLKVMLLGCGLNWVGSC